MRVWADCSFRNTFRSDHFAGRNRKAFFTMEAIKFCKQAWKCIWTEETRKQSPINALYPESDIIDERRYHQTSSASQQKRQ